MTMTKMNRPAVLLTLSACAIAAFVATPAAAQSRAERAAERRAAAEQRLEALQQTRIERLARRTDAFERAATVNADQVSARLSEAEMNILEVWAQIDPAGVADVANTIGDAALKAVVNADGDRLSEDQIDDLTVRAARAATISEEEVADLLANGAVKIEELFDSTDPEEIASTLNEIGQAALDVQTEVEDLREVVKDARPNR
ncbi:MAG: hypothetical protein AAFV51_05105 [Pseudomonadota bacterium]